LKQRGRRVRPCCSDITTLPVVPLSLESVFDDAMRAPTVDDYGDVRLLRGGVRHGGAGAGLVQSWYAASAPRRL
jgi:hypothetical protein